MKKSWSLAILKNTFEGTPWFGDSVMDVLDDIAAEQAVDPAQGKSIDTLVRHMLAWREFALQRFLGNHTYDLEVNSDADWHKIPNSDPSLWPVLLDKLRENQEALVAAVDSFPEEMLGEIVPGKSYRFIDLLSGVVQHDIYHLGQIGLLRRQYA